MNLRQIDPGTYSVFITDSNGNPTQVGWCYVEGSGNNTVEHYVLDNGYSAPTNGEQLRVEHASTSYSSLSEFMTAMAANETPQAPLTYIQSECTRSVGLP